MHGCVRVLDAPLIDALQNPARSPIRGGMKRHSMKLFNAGKGKEAITKHIQTTTRTPPPPPPHPTTHSLTHPDLFLSFLLQ